MDVSIHLFKAVAVFYLFAAALFLCYLVTQRESISKVAIYVYFSGFVLNAFGVIARYIAAGYLPMLNLYELLSFLACCVAGIFFLFYKKYKVVILGVFVSPISLIFVIIALSFNTDIIQMIPVLRSYWRPIHIGFALLGDAMFAIAAFAGVMYLLQERSLKTKKMNMFYYALPSLEVSDKINYRCLTLGFPMLTIGMVTGAIWANEAWGTYWTWDPKETWSLITWFIYAAMLHGRLTVGWRGRKVAILSIIGFLIILFTVLGVNLLIGGTHAEGVYNTTK